MKNHPTRTNWRALPWAFAMASAVMPGAVGKDDKSGEQTAPNKGENWTSPVTGMEFAGFSFGFVAVKI